MGREGCVFVSASCHNWCFTHTDHSLCSVMSVVYFLCYYDVSRVERMWDVSYYFFSMCSLLFLSSFLPSFSFFLSYHSHLSLSCLSFFVTHRRSVVE